MSEQDGDKIFDPTPQRLAKAYAEGQVAFSTELQAAIVFLTGALFLWFAGAWLYRHLIEAIQTRLYFFDGVLSGESPLLVQAGLESVSPVFLLTGILFGTLALAPTLSGLFQTGFNITTKPLELKLSRISPVEGFKRMFSTRSLMRTLTSLARAGIVVWVCWLIVGARVDEIGQAGFGTLESAFGLACRCVLTLSIAVASLMTVVGLGDWVWQKARTWSDLKMTFQEFRQEAKEDSGDPMIKARMRKIAGDRLKQSLAKAIPRASVIVTNPTHFAVALRYDRSEAMAPVVIAKGADHTAKRILELAREHNIPVIERKPVARFLYFRAKVGQMIPMEMYMAVAEILNFVNRRRSA